MGVRTSTFTASTAEGEPPYRRAVTILCDTREEYEQALKDHDQVCVNPDEPKRMKVVNRYPMGKPEVGVFCGAMDEAKTTYCDTTILHDQAVKP